MQPRPQSRRRISAEDDARALAGVPAHRDPRVRDRLVMTFAPLVKYIVYKKIRELPARCEVEDFISCGLEALIASIDRYDPEKGATLEQFAWTRIHGAVLDELRRQDWAPRSLRRWERDIAKAREQFIVAPRPPARPARSSPTRWRPRVDELRTPPGRDRRLRRHLAQHAGDHRRRDHGRAHRHARSRRPAARPRARARRARRPRRSSAAPSNTLPRARARGRRPALRQEPDAARDRRHPRRLREPRLPDPRAAQAHAQGRSWPDEASLFSESPRASGSADCGLQGAGDAGPLLSCRLQLQRPTPAGSQIQPVRPGQCLRHRHPQLFRHLGAEFQAGQRLGQCLVLADRHTGLLRASSRILSAIRPLPAAVTVGRPGVPIAERARPASAAAQA